MHDEHKLSNGWSLLPLTASGYGAAAARRRPLGTRGAAPSAHRHPATGCWGSESVTHLLSWKAELIEDITLASN